MAASINEVRNTVLAIANKNNYGYITPQDFNLYAKQAQLDMFEDYFYSYNNWIQRQNGRSSGTGYADITKGLVEVMDSFSNTVFLPQVKFVKAYASNTKQNWVIELISGTESVKLGMTIRSSSGGKLKQWSLKVTYNGILK